MSQHPNSMNSLDLQIWDNAAFDDGGDLTAAKSWLPLQPISINTIHLPILDPTKGKSLENSCKQNFRSIPNEDNIDAEIKELEKEIRRLSLKLESLRIQKAEKDFKAATVRRERIVVAKFKEQKPSLNSAGLEKSSARVRRRSYSFGPLEIQKSVGKLCFQKLEDIKEEHRLQQVHPCLVDKKIQGFRKDSSGSSYQRSPFPGHRTQEIKAEKKKMQSLSVRPEFPKQSISNVSEFRKGILAADAAKIIEKDHSISEKPLKKSTARIVASRYSLAHSAEPVKKRRKWSLSEPNKGLMIIGESNAS